MTITQDFSAVETTTHDSVLALAASPHFAHDRTCFAARESGLYRSDDGGVTWHDTYASLQLSGPLTTTAVALSPEWPAERWIFAGVDGGILRSTDGGATWSIMTISTPAPLVSTLVVSPNFAHDGIVIAGTLEDGTFRSADRGSSWQPWNFGLLDLSVLVLAISPDFAHDETLFAGTETGLFRSANGGRAWREVNVPAGDTPFVSLACSPDYAHDGCVFAGTESAGLFRSDDSGDSWCEVGADVITETVHAIVASNDAMNHLTVLVLSDDIVHRSDDRGTSWSTCPVEQSNKHDFTMLTAPIKWGPDTPLLIGCADGDVLRVS